MAMNAGGRTTSGVRSKAVLVLTAVLGAALCSLGFPQLIAALAAAPGDAVVSALQSGQAVSTVALDRVLESRRSALRWWRSPRYYRDISRAALYRGERANEDVAAAEFTFQLAVDASVNGLNLAPVDPGSWLRLAAIRLEVQADPQAALAALRAAVATAPYDPARTAGRVRMILELWSILDDTDRLRFQRQFVHLWDDDPEALARIALNDRAFLISLAMLGDDQRARSLTEARDGLLQSHR